MIQEGTVMKNILLTSTGFTNKNIQDKFFDLINIPAEEIKAVFIPTAAISNDAKAMIPVCWSQLLEAGILESNIYTYDLDRIMSTEEICKYNMIYVCGGNTQHLLNKMIESEFGLVLEKFLNHGGVYVGVSAGSVVLASNIRNNLGYVNCILKVHADHGSSKGIIDTTDFPTIYLTNNQAIVLTDSGASIIE